MLVPTTLFILNLCLAGHKEPLYWIRRWLHVTTLYIYFAEPHLLQSSEEANHTTVLNKSMLCFFLFK